QALGGRLLDPVLEAVGPAQEGVSLGSGLDLDGALVRRDGALEVAGHLVPVRLLPELGGSPDRVGIRHSPAPAARLTASYPSPVPGGPRPPSAPDGRRRGDPARARGGPAARRGTAPRRTGSAGGTGIRRGRRSGSGDRRGGPADPTPPPGRAPAPRIAGLACTGGGGARRGRWWELPRRSGRDTSPRPDRRPGGPRRGRGR